MSVLIPAAPPPEVLAEVDAAAARVDELAAAGREVHFITTPGGGRVVIELRTLDGTVLRTLSPSEALELTAR
jgi:hypothetical protein